MRQELFISLATKALDLLFNLIIVWMVSHALGADLRGVLSASIVSIVLIGNFLAFNWGSSSLHHISEKVKAHTTQKIMASGYWASIFWVASLTTALFIVLITTNTLHYLFVDVTPAHVFTVTAFFLFYSLCTSLRSTILMEKGSNTINLTLFISRTLMLLIGATLFFFKKFDVLNALMLYTFFWFVQASLLLFYGKRSLTAASKEVSLYKSLLFYAIFAQIGVIGSYLIFSADILMLNMFQTSSDVGNYSLSMDFVLAALAFVQALAMVFYSKLAQQEDSGWHTLRKNVLFIFIAVLICCVIASFVCGALIRLTLGDDYLLAAQLLTVLIWCIPGHALSALLGRFWISHGKIKLASYFALSIGLINVLLNLLWIPEHGVWGAAWASLIASMLSGFVNLAFAQYINNKQQKNS